MKKSGHVISIAFVVYLVVVFMIFYGMDKRLLAIFCALGSSLYVALIKRFSDKEPQ